jgi:hypothetical protein
MLHMKESFVMVVIHPYTFTVMIFFSEVPVCVCVHVCFETVSHVAHAGLQLKILLPEPL